MADVVFSVTLPAYNPALPRLPEPPICTTPLVICMSPTTLSLPVRINIAALEESFKMETVPEPPPETDPLSICCVLELS